MLALLGNFDHAIKANETAMDSAGSAAKENEAYMGGLEAKTNQVKAAFQELSTSVVNSDFVKGGLDIAISLMEALNTETGATIAQVTLLSGALAGIVGMAVKGNWISTFNTGVKKMGQDFGKFAKVLSMTPKELGVVSVGVGALIGVLDLLTTSYSEATEKAEALNAELAADYGAGSRYDELISRQSELNELEQRELDLLERQKQLKEDMAKMAEKEAYGKWQEEEGMLASYGATTKDIARHKEFTSGLQDMLDDFASGKTGVEDFNDAFVTLLGSQEDYIEQVQKGIDQGYDVSKWQKEHLDLYNQILDVYSNENLTAIEKFGVATYDALVASGKGAEEALTQAGALVDEKMASMEEEASEPIDVEIKYKDNHVEVITDAKNVKDAADDAAGKRKIEFEISTIGDIPSFGIKGGGGSSGKDTSIAAKASGTSNAKGGPTLVNEEGPELISANGRAYVAGNGEPTITNLPEGAVVLSATDTENALRGSTLKSSIPAFKSGSEIIQDAMLGRNPTLDVKVGNYWGDNPPSKPTQPNQPYNPSDSGDSGSSGPSLEEIIKEQNKAFKEQLDLLKDRLEIMEKEGASEKDRIKMLKEIQAEIERQKQWYYDQGLDDNSEYIRDLEKQWLDYENEIKELYEEQAGYYEMLFDVVADKAQDEIDILEKKKQEIQDQNSEIEKQMRLEKALDNLARAKQQKKLVFKDGRMQYVQDVDAISKAQQEVDEINRQDRVDQQLADIDKQIDKWQEYKDAWGSVVDDYNKKQDLLLLKEKFGIDFEADNWQEKLGNLQKYLNKYDKLMAKAGHKRTRLKAGKGAMNLGTGGATLPDTATMDLGIPTPASMMSGFDGAFAGTGGTSISIQNFNPNLPGVSDGEGFVKYLRNNFLQQTLQFANG